MPAEHKDGSACGCNVVESKRKASKRVRSGEPVLCPVHAPAPTKTPEQGMLATVDALLKANISDGRLILQMPMWSELSSTGKRQGRDCNNRLRKGSDCRVDIMQERYFGAVKHTDPDDVVGIEVNGPGHNTKSAKRRDGKKERKAAFHIHQLTVADMHEPSDYAREAEKVLSAWTA